jgi:multiple sugar transport system permease protein
MSEAMVRRVAKTVAILAVAIAFLHPIIWNILTSLKAGPEILQFPPTFVPEHPTLGQFQKLVEAGGGIFVRYFSNTVVMAVSSIVVILVVSSLCSYSLAVIPFPGSNFLFMVILSILMVPFQALLIPLYRMLTSMGLVDTIPGLVLVYSTFFLPFCVFMTRNYFAALPTSIRESALLDGAREFTILTRLYLPLSIPALATVIVFVFLETWNDFILSLIFSNSNSARNVQVGIMNFGRQRYQNDWGIINAGACLAMLPPVFVFLSLQKHYVKGLTSGFSK